MKLLLISDFFPPFIGGAEQITADIATELVERGHQVAVATLWHKGLAEHEIIEGVAVHRLKGAAQRLSLLFSNPERRFHPPMLDPAITLQLRSLMAKLRPQVVQGQSWMLMSALPLRREFGFKTIASLQDYSLICPKKTLLLYETQWCSYGISTHCLRCASMTYGFGKGVLTTAGLTFGQWQARHIDAFLAVSSYVADAHKPHGFPGAKPLHIIPNFLRNEVLEAPLSLPLPNLPEKYILFLGALGHHKGVHVLLEAYQRLQTSLPLVLIGAAQASTPEVLPAGVLVVKGLPHADVLRALDHCQFLVSPAVWPEPFGIVAIEGMARGKAVIASRAGGLMDIVKDMETGLLVQPGDVADLAKALDMLISDPALATRMGTSGRLRCEQTYTASVVIPRLIEVYQELWPCVVR